VSDFVHVVIPLDPVPARRPVTRLIPAMAIPAMLARLRRATKFADVAACVRPHIAVPDAAGGREWKKAATDAIEAVCQARAGRLLAGKGQPVELLMLAVFELPRSRWRVKIPVEPSWQTGHNAGDFDNLAKPFADLATGRLWEDDAQVARHLFEKVVAPQGTAGRLEVLARRLAPVPSPWFHQIRARWAQEA